MIKNVRREDIEETYINIRIGGLFAISDVDLVDLEANVKPKSIPLALPHILKPNEYVLAATIEEMDQKEPKYAVLLTMRSSGFRVGLSMQSGCFGPFAKGPMVFGLKNMSQNNIKIFHGMSLLHLQLIDIRGEPKRFEKEYEPGVVL